MEIRSLLTSVAAAGLAALSAGAFASVTVSQTPLPGSSIPQFVDPVPVFGPAGIPRVTGSSITVNMDEFQQQVLPAPFPKTWVWGYDVGGSGASWPGVTIEAQRGTPTMVTYVNNLPSFSDGGKVQGFLTVDQTIHWADPLQSACFLPEPLNPSVCPFPYLNTVPTVTHLHGAEVQSNFDGTPDQWFTPTGLVGPAYSSLTPVPAGQATFLYANGQEPTTLWFHDHALGITRLNVYGGLAAFYLLRDSRDTGLATNPIGLPAGAQEIELVIQDRQFDTNGQLFFPDGSADGLNGPPPNPSIHPFWIPEFLGDVVTVNGKSWPFLNVEPRRYRFRFLNGSNARFYEMFLVDAVNGQRGPAFWQIGTDGGLLDDPVELNDPQQPKAPKLLLAPGERADVIIDFSAFAGQTFVLRNTARTPFPKGVPPQGSTIGRIMQFRVGTTPVVDNTCDPASPPVSGGCSLRATPIVRLVDPTTGTPAVGVTPDQVRELTLNEVEGLGGPVELLLNNTKWSGKKDLVAGTPVPGSKLLYGDPHVGTDTYTLELPRVGSTEEWDVINVSADAHPIHLHLIQFQLMNRQNFNVNTYTAAYAAAFPGGAVLDEAGPPMDYNTPNADGAIGGNPAVGPFLQGPVQPPEPNEAGWKDTVIMYPGQVTRIMARWAQQDVAVGSVTPGENTYPFDPTVGPGYVWHCHILDHEDNEMMHPYAVQP